MRLLANPLRWRLLRELVHSDRAVRELTELLGERQSLVSYHLRLLRAGGLVRARRSSADGRDSYYTVDLAGCREQLQAAGGALHPGLGLAAAPPPARRSQDAPGRRLRVLFLCTGNSARSQIAEALLESMSEGRVAAASAGSHPKPLHPNAVRVDEGSRDRHQRRTGPNPSTSSPRSPLTVVVTLCDRVREVCPDFPSHPDLVHWSVPDPVLAGPDDRATVPAFEQLATELETRIGFLLRLLEEPTTRRSTHA